MEFLLKEMSISCSNKVSASFLLISQKINSKSFFIEIFKTCFVCHYIMYLQVAKTLLNDFKIELTNQNKNE